MTPDPDVRTAVRRDVARSLASCVIVDCETTGLDPDLDRIIDIAVLRVRRGRPVALFHRRVRPGVPVPAPIAEMTGITDAEVSGAPSVHEILPDLVSFLGDDTLVGHNVAFDIAFIDAAVTASGSLPRPPVASLCTAESARALIPRHKVGRYRLGTLADVLGLEHRPRHRSVEDVFATFDLLGYLDRVNSARAGN